MAVKRLAYIESYPLPGRMPSFKAQLVDGPYGESVRLTTCVDVDGEVVTTTIDFESWQMRDIARWILDNTTKGEDE